MWHLARPSFFALIFLSAFALPGCSRSSTEIHTTTNGPAKINVSKGQSISEWKVNIVQVSQPDTVKIKSKNFNEDDEPSPPGKKWLTLAIELTPPSAEASLLIKQIKLVDESSGIQTPLSLAPTQDAEVPKFTYFSDSFGVDMIGRNQAGLGVVDKEGKLVWLYTLNKETNEVVLIIKKVEPQKMVLLFAIPASARNLSLQI